MEPVEQEESFINLEQSLPGQIQIGYGKAYSDPPSDCFYKYATVG